MVWKMIFLLNWVVFGFHVNLPGCIFSFLLIEVLLWYFDLITFLDQVSPTREKPLNRRTVLDASKKCPKSLGEIHQVTELLKTPPSKYFRMLKLVLEGRDISWRFATKTKKSKVGFQRLRLVLYCEVGKNILIFCMLDSPWPPKQTKRNHCIAISLGVPRCETYAISSDISFHLYQLSILDVSCYVIREQVNKSSNHSFLIQNHY